MHKKIVRSFLITFLITFLLGFGLLYVSLYKASISQDRQYLMNTVKLVKNLEIDDLNTTRLGDTFKSEDIRITIIKRNGKVLYDNYKDKISEKHLQREEVKQALEKGTGTCIRHSSTMQRSYLYVADYEDDNQTIVRLAMPFDGLSQSISILLAPFIFSICLSFMVVFILSKRMADEIVEPFQDITNTINSTNISEDVLTFNTYNYPELYKITNALTNMSKENKKYLERLEKEKLIYTSNTDELTRCLNRHAYENDMKKLNLSEEWVYISVDLNGLKWEDRVIKLNVQPAAVGNQ